MSEFHTLVSIEKKSEMFRDDSRQMQRFERNYIANREKIMNRNKQTNTSGNRPKSTSHNSGGWNDKYSIAISVIIFAFLLFISICYISNTFNRQREDDQEEDGGNDIELGAKDNLSKEERRLFIASRLTVHVRF